MGKKKKRYRKRKKNITNCKNKKKVLRLDFHIILIIFFVLLTIILGILLIEQYNKNKDIKDKLVNLDNLSNEVLTLKNNYDDLSEIDKKIDGLTGNNNLLNNDIENLKKKIDDLNSNIAKYRK